MSEPTDLHPEPVVVAVHTDRGEAEVTVAHLGSEGIQAFVIDDAEGGTIHVEGEGGVAVMVGAADADRARRVLAGGSDAD